MIPKLPLVPDMPSKLEQATMRNFILLILLACLSLPVSVNTVNAEELTSKDCSATIVFDLFDGERSKILLKTYSSNKWSEPDLVYESAKELGFNPVVASDKSGNILVLWPSSVNGKTRIRYRVRRADGTWEKDADYLGDGSGENTTPAVLSDLDNNIWVAWASDAAGFDDIYTRRWSNGNWSESRVDNQKNNVPDITPVLTRFSGVINLTWRSYDHAARRYVERSKAIGSYSTPSAKARVLSDLCNSIDYDEDGNDASSGAQTRAYLDKTNVISDNTEIFRVR